MPRVSQTFRSAFKRASDVTEPMIVKLGSWREESAYGEDFYVVELVDQDADLRLTSALSYDIAKILGDEIADWEGGTVELYSEPIVIKDRKSGEDKEVQRLRARLAPGQKAVPNKPPPPIDNDIPY
jgi:hypothetical protein